jgi:quercetin dioxygenase-like cupin family protein
MINVDGEDREVKPGSIVFVGAGVDHKFHTITENLMLLVVFAPPRGSRASS